MKVANTMRCHQQFLSYAQTLFIACVVTILLAGCQSSSSSSSSSSPSTPSTPQSSQSSPSSSSPSSASSSSQEQQTQAGEQSGGEESSTEGGIESSTEGGEKSSTEGGADNESTMGSEDIYGETGAGSSGTDEVLSEEEAVAILDGQLDTSIAVFDGMIVNERVAAQSAANELPDDDTLYGDDNPLFEEADISEDSDSSGSSGSDGAEENSGDPYSESGSETGNNTVASNNGGINTNRGGARVPSDIPNGSDDDIVARQIREAAIKEQDPVLREKLWEEYRKYKRGQ